MNLKKVYRLYCEEGLAVGRRRGRKRVLGTRRLASTVNSSARAARL